MKNQTSVLSSRSQTPVPHSDPMLQKQLLLQLVKQGNIDEAFQQVIISCLVNFIIKSSLFVKQYIYLFL